MHTQCPHCKTLFKISEEQLTAVNGKVRCGFCYRIFLAEETLYDELPNLDLDNGSPPPEELHQSAEEPEVPPITEVVNLAQNELKAATRKHLDNSITHKKSVPNFVWALGTLTFTAVLILQYSYFMRDDLAKYSEIRPALQQLCALANCTIPLQRSPAQIKLVNREITAHPNIENALRVQATFINKASFPQTYPTLKLTLSDLEGKTVATRHFKPLEYLPENTKIGIGLAALQQTEIQLDIRDPDKKATGFELAFL